MAPRRNNNPHGGSGLDVQNFLSFVDNDDSYDGSSSMGRNASTVNHNLITPLMNLSGQSNLPGRSNINSSFVKCCLPSGECLKASREFCTGLINLEDLSDSVKVLCNNDHCTAGQYMHRECFESWEQIVLGSLKTIGRARSWSDRQRAQNLWTKKGYDLVFKACGCKCGRGHLRKDLDWTPPVSNIFGRVDEEVTKKKKKRNRNNQKPTLAISTQVGYHPNSQAGNGGAVSSVVELRGRTGSVSSSNGSMSPPVYASSEHSLSPLHSARKCESGQHVHQQQQHDPKANIEIYSERVRSTSGCNGIFSRRLDFSSFNLLPRTRLNSYQVKMEDEGNHGNDETRLFILSSLAQHQKSRVSCIICEEAMLVFDRYPLVDGTFFLSPKQHSQGCIEVKYETHIQYLTAVCMGCLDGGPNRAICCRFCCVKWDGSSLVLGTMYSYDIFAAMPCCQERLKCNNCFELLLHPQQRLNFFSDYSHVVSCPYCAVRDAHFVKPLSYCYTKQQTNTCQVP